MSTQSAIRSPGFSTVDHIVDSIAASASDALANFDALKSQDKSTAEKSRPPVTSNLSAAPLATSMWLQPTPLQSASRFGKSGLFALVVLVHAVAFYALSRFSPHVSQASTQPIEVMMLSESQSKDVPPPPMQLPRMPTFDLPVEPVVIDVAEPAATAISVAMRAVEPEAAPSEAVGTPKTVSSVEYIREPAIKYPPAARLLKQRGTVTLRALIDINGKASQVDVHRSSNFRVLDDAARTAVLNALFKPYVENGHAVPVYVFIPVEFGLAAS
jgi:protein TonB